MGKYQVLNTQEFSNGRYKIVPIRLDDRYLIMKWRNEQLFHLRQSKKLTAKEQDIYFDTVVKSLFPMDSPPQILFSYLEDGICIGYGGLVHIDWAMKTAEISFVMDTALQEAKFELHWKTYLALIERLAFDELDFNSIFTYAYDLRPRLYPALEDSGFIKAHEFVNDDNINVVIHSKTNTNG